MKVLWFSNCVIGNTICKGSGSWLFAMKSILSKYVELYNITSSKVNSIVHNKCVDVDEYILPSWSLKNGIPTENNIEKIRKIVDEINPDVIHVWGIEQYWALLFTRGYIKRKVLLEVQGLLSSCNDVYYAGLTPIDLLKCIGVKELLQPQLCECFQKLETKKKSVTETECFQYFKHISTQSDWTRKQLKYVIGNNAILYHALRPIRDNFYKALKWEYPKNDKLEIYTSFSYYVPFKGLHILIQAVALLKNKYPNVILKIGGPNIKNKIFYRQSGYERYLLSLIQHLHLENNIVFLGNLDADSIIKELKNSTVFVNPSFVESYSAATAEALYLGVPSVLAYSGAMPDFSANSQIALYYSPMDYKSCAAQIGNFYENIKLCHDVSLAAIHAMEQRCKGDVVREKQLYIYKNFCDN